jgi:hypothetical protein
MNTGLQDAHNLALKLVDVIERGAGDAHLDSYQTERRPVAGRLVGTTDRLFRVVTATDPVTRTVRRVVVPLLAPVLIRIVPRLRGSSRVFEYLSQTRIHYWMSPAAQAAGRRGRVVGRRLRWTGDNFEVLRSARWQVHSYAALDPPGSVGAEAWEQLGRLGLELHRFPPAPRTALRPDLLYLVRPDGFVAAEAPRPQAVGTFRAALPEGLRLEVGTSSPES